MRAAAMVVGVCACLAAFAQEAMPGKQVYENRCSTCHGGDGNGGELAPAIAGRIAARDDHDLAILIRQGLPGAGMPGAPVADAEMRQLTAYLRTLKPRGGTSPTIRIEITGGKQLEGIAVNRSFEELQLLTPDKRLHLLRKDGDRYRPVTSETGWSTYHGNYSGNRYSELKQIERGNVSRLAPRWVFAMQGVGRLQTTPVVVDGVMYVTNANECYALDAGSGRQIWHYRRPRTKGLVGDAASGMNRGVAVAGDRLFMVTDNAHLLSLHRATGALLWETPMADWRRNYNATSAPLTVGNLVISGSAGGDEGVRGFVAAFDQTTGKQVWRFWTVPLPGEPGSETWKGKDIEHPGATAWFTGTYDPVLDTLYWPVGNPGPDYDGDQRLGDNLYSDSILALDPKTGKLKWHYQYTPHDLWDWDSQQPPVLVDATWEGKPRKLLLHANRNGFFYVLDRTDGKLLLAKPFVKKLTWAKEIGADGRPVLVPGKEPTPQGTLVCPAVEGATNWFSTSFNPETELYYVQALEKCNIFTKSPSEWQAGRSYYSGSTQRVPSEVPEKILRAIDIRSGRIAWELPQVGPGDSWGGVLTTAGGLVFFGEDSGLFMAADTKTGKRLWSFPTNQLWKASPMTYVFDGKQYVAIASGPNILSFALMD